jgi:ABC-type molybdate transport system permease subunit
VFVSVILSPKDAYFISNVCFFWLPQLAVLAFSWPFRPSAAVVAGAALALAIYLGLFHAWVFSHSHPDSMAWLGYLFSLPGAAVGSILASLWLRDRFIGRPIAASCIAAGVVFAGALLNQAIVCATVMDCGK